MKKVLCPECAALTVPEIKKAEREVEIRGEKIKVISEMPQCGNCHREFLLKDGGKDSYILAYDVYRKKHNMLFPSEISEIRQKYGMSPKPFSLLLGWGELTVYKYEKGALQDDAHDEVLKLISDPENMKSLYDSKLKENLKPEERAGFESVLDRLCAGINPYERIIKLNFGYKPDEYSGNTAFQLKKTVNTILKVIDCSVKRELFEVQLLKCLFYSDFIFFRDNKISITGMKYANATYGPIPHNYQDILFYMIGEKMLNKEIIQYENGNEGHRYTAAKKADTSLFNDVEKKHIEYICEKLTPLGSKQLSDKTHMEVQGWKETESGQLISYRYAEKIKGI